MTDTITCPKCGREGTFGQWHRCEPSAQEELDAARRSLLVPWSNSELDRRILAQRIAVFEDAVKKVERERWERRMKNEVRAMKEWANGGQQ